MKSRDYHWRPDSRFAGVVLNFPGLHVSYCIVFGKLSIDVSQNRNRFLSVVLVSLVFAGQVMASSILPCMNDMPNQSDGMDMDMDMVMDMMHHSDHAMDSNSGSSSLISKPTLADCCDHDYGCSMGNCLSVILPTRFQYDGAPDLSHEIDESRIFAISLPPAALYRPPISR